jgi:uncharacterized membrane protein (GlpM family)
MIWSFGMGCVTEGLSPGLVPFFFVFFLMYNIIGGWNIDVADQGFKVRRVTFSLSSLICFLLYLCFAFPFFAVVSVSFS